ncbi:DNA-binding transcriptional regulator CytR [Candidatus Regiella endosymbiont of Tuberolachnus salignus]|uniref:DNA-binding transcriptional regulator CytR n=1 Tax=Candidatus Regiella endosymbiont of Tuberolachnus salignus TaxID=3077956 RepID=UPI0030D403FD
MEQKKKLTMKNVAEIAGVSTATVSRTLMKPEKVSSDTRKKVEQAVVKAGYYPNALCRNVKHRKSHNILVIVPDISDPFFLEIIQGIKETALDHSYLIIIVDCVQQIWSKKTIIDLTISKKIAGMLLLGANLPFDITKEQQPNLPPMVMANEFVPELELSTVHIDNLSAAFQAVNYLYKLGHQHIACVAGLETMPLSYYRLQGYIQALRRNNIAIKNEYIVRAHCSYESGIKAFATLMALPYAPTAIFFYSDIMAVGAIWQAKQLGLRIPQDVSLIGFDNLKCSQYCDPPLTTVAQPSYQIGQKVMLLLLDQLAGKRAKTGSHLLDYELIIRKSTAIPTALQVAARRPGRETDERRYTT